MPWDCGCGLLASAAGVCLALGAHSRSVSTAPGVLGVSAQPPLLWWEHSTHGWVEEGLLEAESAAAIEFPKQLLGGSFFSFSF